MSVRFNCTFAFLSTIRNEGGIIGEIEGSIPISIAANQIRNKKNEMKSMRN